MAAGNGGLSYFKREEYPDLWEGSGVETKPLLPKFYTNVTLK
jgi:hypothetical protein